MGNCSWVGLAKAACEETDPSDLPGLIGELEHLKAIAQLRLFGQAPAIPVEDSLLDTEQAAEILAVTKEWLYSRNDLPFIVRPGPGQRRYSRLGLQKWIKRQMK